MLETDMGEIMGETEYTMEEIFPVVAKLAGQYAGYESTSVTYERAQQLMAAVIYCIREYEMSAANGLMPGRPNAAEAYKLGYDIAVQKVLDMKTLYHEVMEDFKSFGVLCLEDTMVRGIVEFLKWYDVRYAPQETLLTLDYPVLMDIHGLYGIDAIYAYVRCIDLEQKFISAFDHRYVEQLLRAYSPRYKDMIENICSIVLTGALGHILAGKPMDSPGFLRADYERMRQALGEFAGDDMQNGIPNCMPNSMPNCTPNGMPNCMPNSMRRQIWAVLNGFICAYYDDAEELMDYFSSEVDNISTRIGNALKNGYLERVFLL